MVTRKPEPRRRSNGDDYESYRSNDPVRVYLREMGAVSLLTREGEVVIAKRIEAGEKDGLRRVLKSSIAVAKLLDIGDLIRKGKREVRDLFPPIGLRRDSNQLELRRWYRTRRCYSEIPWASGSCSKPTFLWVLSQNGLFAERPQRHRKTFPPSGIFSSSPPRLSSFRPSASTA